MIFPIEKRVTEVPPYGLDPASFGAFGDSAWPESGVKFDERAVSEAAGTEFPWTPTANGDDTINVSAGGVLTCNGDYGNLNYSRATEWAGGDVLVTAATGFVYGSVDASLALYQMATPSGSFTDSGGDTVDVNVPINRIFVANDAVVTVSFAETIPLSPTVFHFEIAQVTLTDGVAAVTNRALYANPVLWSFIEPP